MQASMSNLGDITIIRLSGHVDVETAGPFRQLCVGRLKGHKVVFDFQALSFVGSSGILAFLEAFDAFVQANPGSCKFSSIGSEFGKVLGATSLKTVECYQTPELAAFAFTNPTIYTPVSIDAVPLVNEEEKEASEVLTVQPVDFGLLAFPSDPATINNNNAAAAAAANYNIDEDEASV